MKRCSRCDTVKPVDDYYPSVYSTGLGMFRDDPEVMANAIRYVQSTVLVR